MKILISGSTGFIGSRLVPLLQASGHEVTRLVRFSDQAGLHWDPYKKQVDLGRMEGYDVFVNLSGESISGRWLPAKRKKIMDSRVLTGQFFCECIGALRNPPKAFISASAIGYYGNRRDEELTESSVFGAGFLVEVTKAWEAAMKPIEKMDIRVVNVRTGLVLSPEGGALKQLLPPFKMGVGGVVGSGKQWWSWIALNDLLRIYQYSIENNEIKGVVNAVAPHPLTNKDFVKTLGKVLHRPSIFPLPAFVVKLIFGDMGQELLLEGQKVIPKKLMDAGFGFEQTELETALKSML
jgi:uncharacterized protein (TIGR01777 family)